MRVSIIGSGVSGICAAIRLKSKGFDVAVYEKNKMPGGKLNTFKLDGIQVWCRSFTFYDATTGRRVVWAQQFEPQGLFYVQKKENTL